MSHLQRSPHIPLQTAPSNQCLTGCLYQVVQTPGQQGSNILTLLPIVKSKDHPFPTAPVPLTPSASTLHVPPTVIPSPRPPVSILSRPGPVSVPLLQPPANYIIAAQNNLHVETPFQLCQETTLLLDNAQVTLPANPASGNPTVLMMNMKQAGPVKPAPMLPSGHSLQIPSHAEVISVPVSSLPFSIQQKILPQAGVMDGGKIPSVIYVSPVNTVRSNNHLSSPGYPGTNSASVVPATKSPLQPPTRGGEAPKGPMKWVVQEPDTCLVPVKSSNDTASKILQMLSKTKMENVNLTGSDQSKVVQIKENALVMCNNKIFFLSKKGTELIDAGNKSLEPPQYSSPDKPAAQIKPTKDLSNKVVQVVLSKNKSPPPSTEELVQSNVVSTAKPKRKSSTPRAHRSDPAVIYIPDDDEGCSHVSMKPPDPLSNRSDPANNGVPVKEDHQSLPKAHGTKVAPAARAPEARSGTEVAPAARAPEARSGTEVASAARAPEARSGTEVAPAARAPEARSGTEVAPAARAPEASGTDDRSWRQKFGLLKKEKIVLKRIPLIRARSAATSDSSSQGDGKEVSDPVEMTPQQLKRKSSSNPAATASKTQKSSEGGDATHPEASTDSPSPSPVSASFPVPRGRSPESTTWSPTHCGGEASYPPDIADFQVEPEIPGHYSDVSLPTRKFHMDSFSSLYSDETTKDEKIQRLKEVLKERENAVEALRRQKKT